MKKAKNSAALMLVAAGLTLSACARQPAAEGPAPSGGNASAGTPTAVRGGTIITERVDSMPAGAPITPPMGDPTIAELAAIAPGVAGLLAAPTVIIIGVGDTVTIRDAVRLTMFDSTGAFIGALALHDVRMSPGAAVLAMGNAPSITGRSVGSALLWLSFPSRAWGARTGTPARIAIPIFVVERP